MHAPTGQARGLLVNLLDRSQPKQAEALIIAGQLCDALDAADGEIEQLSMTISRYQRKGKAANSLPLMAREVAS